MVHIHTAVVIECVQEYNNNNVNKIKAKYPYHLKLTFIFTVFLQLHTDNSLQCLLYIFFALKSIFIAHKIQGFPQTKIMEKTVAFFVKSLIGHGFPQWRGTGEDSQLAEKLGNPTTVCPPVSVQHLQNFRHQFHNPCVSHIGFAHTPIGPPAKSCLPLIMREHYPHKSCYLGNSEGQEKVKFFIRFVQILCENKKQRNSMQILCEGSLFWHQFIVGNPGMYH